jgi:homoserine acetyltransferase
VNQKLNNNTKKYLTYSLYILYTQKLYISIYKDNIMNMSVDLSQVAGKNIEDLTTEELSTIAWQAGHEAYLKAKKQGFRVTALQNGHLVWVYPDGHTEPVSTRKTI